MTFTQQSQEMPSEHFVPEGQKAVALLLLTVGLGPKPFLGLVMPVFVVSIYYFVAVEGFE